MPNTSYPLEPQLLEVTGPGGLPFLEVQNAHARARVSLQGAQLLSFRPHGAAADWLYLSEQAIYQTGKAIRGGVPVCWPWFGPDPLGQGRPAHGLARTRRWTLRHSAHLPDGQTLLTLGLSDSPDTRLLWPHAFDLVLDITIGATLQLALHTHNRGNTPFQITQALHSYWAVQSVEQTTVHGLADCRFSERAAGADRAPQVQTRAVSFGTEVDRLYSQTPADLQLNDGAGQRQLALHSEGSRSTVVWNPGALIAAGMTDLPDSAWRRFVCVETANAGDDVITLAPGAVHRLAVHIRTV